MDGHKHIHIIYYIRACLTKKIYIDSKCISVFGICFHNKYIENERTGINPRASRTSIIVAYSSAEHHVEVCFRKIRKIELIITITADEQQTLKYYSALLLLSLASRQFCKYLSCIRIIIFIRSTIRRHKASYTHIPQQSRDQDLFQGEGRRNIE